MFPPSFRSLSASPNEVPPPPERVGDGPSPTRFRSWTLEPVILALLWALPFVDWPPCHKPSRLPRPPSGGRPLRAEDRSGHSWPGAGELGVQIPGSLDLASADSEHALCKSLPLPGPSSLTGASMSPSSLCHLPSDHVPTCGPHHTPLWQEARYLSPVHRGEN